jgi:hypothetical protein
VLAGFAWLEPAAVVTGAVAWVAEGLLSAEPVGAGGAAGWEHAASTSAGVVAIRVRNWAREIRLGIVTPQDCTSR